MLHNVLMLDHNKRFLKFGTFKDVQEKDYQIFLP